MPSPRHGRPAAPRDGVLEAEVCAAELLPVNRYQKVSRLDHDLANDSAEKQEMRRRENAVSPLAVEEPVRE